MEDHRLIAVPFDVLYNELKHRPEWNTVESLLEFATLKEIHDLLFAHADQGSFIFFSQYSDDVLVTTDVPNQKLREVAIVLAQVWEAREGVAEDDPNDETWE